MVFHTRQAPDANPDVLPCSRVFVVTTEQKYDEWLIVHFGGFCEFSFVESTGKNTEGLGAQSARKNKMF